MTTLLIIRHGQSISNLERYFTGQLDTPLTEMGHRQAALTARYIASNYRVDAVYTSDLSRAYHTGKAVADELGLPVTQWADLREIYGGKWEGTRFDALPAHYPDSFAVWHTDIGSATPDGGESVKAMQKRVIDAITRIAEENHGKTVVIACHGTPIRALQCHCEGKTLSQMNDVPWVTNASVSTVIYHRGSFTMPVVSYDAHLGNLVSTLPPNV